MSTFDRNTSSLRAGLVAALAAGLALPSLALAQSQSESPDTEMEETGQTGAVEEVVVWGTAVRSDLMANLDQEEISLRQADHLSDLLRIVPGVDIGGTHSVNSRINIRGLDDRELSVYIDGALQTNYLYHHLGNLLVNADILQSAEIEVGANSVTDAGHGGVVRFRTKSAADLLRGTDKTFGARVMGSYNDNAQTAFSATAYAQFDSRVDGLAYFHQVDRDNFEDGSGRATIGSDGITNNLLLKLGINLAPGQRLQFSYDQLDDSGNYTQRPDMGVLTNQAITGNLLLPTDYQRDTFNASYDLDMGEALQLEATYYTNDMELLRDERNLLAVTQNGNTLKSAESENQGVNILAESLLPTGALTHTFRYGLQYFDQNLAFYQDLDLGTAPIKQSAQTTAFFLEDEIALPLGVTLRPGVRFTNYEVTYDATGENGSFDDWTYGIAGEWEIFDGFRLLASYTEIFQGPELAEPFAGRGSNKIINPDLEPETGENIEGGLRYTTTIPNGTFAFGGNYFQTTIDGYIGEIAVPGTTTGETQDANLGEIVLDGYEASLMVTWYGVDLFVSHNVSDFDTSGLTAGLSESFREIGDTTSYEIAYTFERFDVHVSLNGQYVADKETSLGTEKPSYTVHNLQLRWNEPLDVAGLTLTAGVDNLFDEAYTSHASRTGAANHPVFGPLILNDVEPGRNIKFTIAKTF